MEENKEQILADFQSCTGIDNVAECLLHLDASNWNLLDAINTVMPQETQTLPSERIDIPMEIDRNISIELPPESIPAKASCSSPYLSNRRISSLDDIVCLTDSATQSSSSSQLLNFSVRYKENTFPLEVPDSETVASIKTALHAELGVPACRQELYGWKQNHITDDTILSSLNLPQQTTLFLSTPDRVAVATDDEKSSFSDRLNASFKLHIRDETNKLDYDLSFPGSKTVLEIKQDIYDLTNIPVRFQKWTGWPSYASDENITLAALETTSPVHELTVKREEPARSSNEKQAVVNLTSSESSDNDFEDASECFGVDDDIFHSGTTSKKLQPLMPENIDESNAIGHFSTEFANRYGNCHPVFFQGTLSEALQSSCQKPAKERKPLAIYLHHDASVLTNVFCTQLLCSETVVTYLTLNFITWAWDLTSESNKLRFLSSVAQYLGIAASTAIRNISVDNLPALMVITKVRSTSEVLTVIPGNVSLDELMTRLIHSSEVFNSEMATEIWEEEEREAREQVKREQDIAYEESLMADRAKEEARRLEVEKKQRQMEQQQQEEEVKEAIRQSLAEQLPPEPPEGGDDVVSHIRIRLPSGGVIFRRFKASSPLSVLFMFIASQGFGVEEYKVLASWPRRDLTTLDQTKTLEALKLFPKETLTVEER